MYSCDCFSFARFLFCSGRAHPLRPLRPRRGGPAALPLPPRLACAPCRGANTSSRSPVAVVARLAPGGWWSANWRLVPAPPPPPPPSPPSPHPLWRSTARRYGEHWEAIAWARLCQGHAGTRAVCAMFPRREGAPVLESKADSPRARQGAPVLESKAGSPRARLVERSLLAAPTQLLARHS